MDNMIKGDQILVLFLFIFSVISCTQRNTSRHESIEYSGSESCRECHENFYLLWSPSFHGQAMMPVNAEFIAKHKLPNSKPVEVEGHMFNVEFQDSILMIFEKDGDKLIKAYNVLWAMGGHNVYCFLTPFENGKLQNIPLAYDANEKIWFNYPEAGMRHFGGEYPDDEALPWKYAAFSFNTGCYSCHISQLSTNFDLSTYTYHTTWNEPGINCETCHGPGSNHVQIFKNLKEGETPEELGLISTKVFTQQQQNDACAPCHSKMAPITPEYLPGNNYFDHYNLTTLEDYDFYPDGRSLGENYTFTEWKMNPCKNESELHCVTCHTSSGRDRNKDNPNNSCLQCHTNKAENIAAHTGHKPEDKLTCLSCHMPKRQFVGRFFRSDHSFRPPMPEATIKFGSPNACNLCHTNKTPEWANKIVKARINGNYQDETLKWAQLIQEARENDWTNVDKMYATISNPKTNEVVANSLIRLLGDCALNSKTDVLLKALNNKSELVRSSAANGLTGINDERVRNALLKACEDEIRLVRIQAANAILAFPDDSFTPEQLVVIKNAENEYVESMTSRLDNWSNHYNLGIYYQNKGEIQKALESYETASNLYPLALLPLINSSVIYSYIGDQQKAEENLEKAITVDPENEAANLNLGLLLAEQGRVQEAEQALKRALETNPEQAVAAYNLSVLTASRNIQEAVNYAKTAVVAKPDDPKYLYTYAYFLNQNNQQQEAIKQLEKNIEQNPNHISSISLLGNIYVENNRIENAIKIYNEAIQNMSENPQIVGQLQNEIKNLKTISRNK